MSMPPFLNDFASLRVRSLEKKLSLSGWPLSGPFWGTDSIPTWNTHPQTCPAREGNVFTCYLWLPTMINNWPVDKKQTNDWPTGGPIRASRLAINVWLHY